MGELLFSDYIRVMEEKWKPWINQYVLSNEGRVMNYDTSKVLSLTKINRAKYVKIKVNGKQRTMSVNKAMREIWQK